jgi:hexokinase
MSSGGTNLRVGFVELFGKDAPVQGDNAGKPSALGRSSHMERRLEKSWPIDDQLKNENADGLFLWIGKHIAEVVADGCEAFQLPQDKTLPMGVTFSFPMVQQSLSEATLMSMGKGFAVSSNLDLGTRLLAGYNAAKTEALPPIQIVAIANDSVSTLVSFIFKYDESAQKRAGMGLILGTGSNATVPLKLSCLHPSKRPSNVSVLPGERVEDVKITVNTEWSIKGTAGPLRELFLVTRWDEELDSQTEAPGFQPLEYMTAGRYLGELGRLILVDYLTTIAGWARESLPSKLLHRHGMTTTFLSHFKPLKPQLLLSLLEMEFPVSTYASAFAWTEELAEVLYSVAKAIEIRAAGIIAAAILALLTLAEEVPLDPAASNPAEREIGVGYTGGCIVHFQDYLVDCQDFLDQLVGRRFGSKHEQARVVLSPCHDGGITGAGILVAAASGSLNAQM